MSVEETQDRLKMSDGFGIFYRRWKPAGRAKRVVFGLHGIGGHSLAFDFVGKDLAMKGSAVYAMDRRGFGNSVEPGYKRGDISSFQRHVKDVDEFGEFVRRSNPGMELFVFGKSLGCVHALQYAAGHPQSFEGLILAAPPVLTRMKRPLRMSLRLSLLTAFAPGTLVGTSSKQNSKQLEMDRVEAAEDPPSVGRYSVRYLGGLRSSFGAVLLDASRIEKPTLVIQGGKDELTTPDGAEKLIGALAAKDKTLKMFPDADHSLYGSIPWHPAGEHDQAKMRSVNDAVQTWLEAH